MLLEGSSRGGGDIRGVATCPCGVRALGCRQRGVRCFLSCSLRSLADGCGVGNLTEPVAVSLRHPGEGADPVAAYWNFEVLGGMGGWSAEGCQLAAREPNVTSLHCRHLSNVAVLMVGGGEKGAGVRGAGSGV